MSENAKQYVVIGSCPLHFYPGTLNPTPPGYRPETISEPMSRCAALALLRQWAAVVIDPRWEFRIEEAALAHPEPQ